MMPDRQIPLFGSGGSGRPGSAAETPDGPGRPAARRGGAPDASRQRGGGPADPRDHDPRGIPDGRSPDRPLPVSALNHVAHELVERTFEPIWVVGEVANWRAASSGHRWFSLRDEHAQVQCVMFQSDASRLPADPDEGMEVLAFGQPSLYVPRGRFQLIVRRLEGRGEGLWRLAFERLRRRLLAEGLLDPSRKRALPPFPRRIGVVTSRHGAALRDVLTVVRRRAPWASVLVRDCRVQGDGAAGEVCRAIELLGRQRPLDLLIVTRGGGSVEDLWCFNEERVARAVAACPVPVISAVGHETDVTIVDLVADVRAPTPSAAGELAVPDREELRARLAALAGGLRNGLRRRTRLGAERGRRLGERLHRAVERRLDRWGRRLDAAAGRLDALSPLGTLARGYAVPMGEDGTVLRRADMFEEGRSFRLRVQDGVVRATADAVEPVPGEPHGKGS